jgi:hypothetical protein
MVSMPGMKHAVATRAMGALFAWSRVDGEIDRRARKRLRPSDSASVAAFIPRLWPVQTNHRLVRVGPRGDSGYLIPDDLAAVGACFPPGVGDVTEFEDQLVEFGIQSWLTERLPGCRRTSRT